MGFGWKVILQTCNRCTPLNQSCCFFFHKTGKVVEHFRFLFKPACFAPKLLIKFFKLLSPNTFLAKMPFALLQEVCLNDSVFNKAPGHFEGPLKTPIKKRETEKKYQVQTFSDLYGWPSPRAVAFPSYTKQLMWERKGHQTSHLSSQVGYTFIIFQCHV